MIGRSIPASWRSRSIVCGLTPGLAPRLVMTGSPGKQAQHEEHEGGRGYQQEDAGSHAPDDEPEHRSVAAPARQPLFAALSMWSWPPPSTQAPVTLFLTADAICAWSGTQIGTSRVLDRLNLVPGLVPLSSRRPSARPSSSALLKFAGDQLHSQRFGK